MNGTDQSENNIIPTNSRERDEDDEEDEEEGDDEEEIDHNFFDENLEDFFQNVNFEEVTDDLREQLLTVVFSRFAFKYNSIVPRKFRLFIEYSFLFLAFSCLFCLFLSENSNVKINICIRNNLKNQSRSFPDLSKVAVVRFIDDRYIYKELNYPQVFDDKYESFATHFDRIFSYMFFDFFDFYFVSFLKIFLFKEEFDDKIEKEGLKNNLKFFQKDENKILHVKKDLIYKKNYKKSNNKNRYYYRNHDTCSKESYLNISLPQLREKTFSPTLDSEPDVIKKVIMFTNKLLNSPLALTYYFIRVHQYYLRSFVLRDMQPMIIETSYYENALHLTPRILSNLNLTVFNFTISSLQCDELEKLSFSRKQQLLDIIYFIFNYNYNFNKNNYNKNNNNKNSNIEDVNDISNNNKGVITFDFKNKLNSNEKINIRNNNDNINTDYNNNNNNNNDNNNYNDNKNNEEDYENLLKRKIYYRINSGYIKNLKVFNRPSLSTHLFLIFKLFIYILCFSTFLKNIYNNVLYLLADNFTHILSPFLFIKTIARVVLSALALYGTHVLISNLFVDMATKTFFLSLIWLGEQFYSIFCRSPTSKKIWLRFFYLYLFIWYLVLVKQKMDEWLKMIMMLSCWLFIQHSMFFFFHRFEIPFVLRRSLFLRQQREINRRQFMPRESSVVNNQQNFQQQQQFSEQHQQSPQQNLQTSEQQQTSQQNNQQISQQQEQQLHHQQTSNQQQQHSFQQKESPQQTIKIQTETQEIFNQNPAEKIKQQQYSTQPTHHLEEFSSQTIQHQQQQQNPLQTT